jgi:hypothetical protein
VEHQERIRESHDEACGAADILEAPLDLKEMSGIGSLKD